MLPSPVRMTGALSLVAVGLTIAASALGHAAAAVAPSPQSAAPVVDVVRLEGVVGPATARYVIRGLRQAIRGGAQALVVVVDTPGGLLKSPDDTPKALLNPSSPRAAYLVPAA